MISLYSLACLTGWTQANNPKQAAKKLSLDNGWRFYQGDIPMPVIKGHGMSYGAAKAGKAFGAADPEFDDTEWRLINLPHDWAVESPYDSGENISQGYRKRGIGWYRRNFKVDSADRGKHFELQMDGVATHCTVWVNGLVVHRNWSGYAAFYIDLTPFLKYGEELNNIAVRVDANAQEGWWYEGAGIYRHTWLVKTSPVHVITDGIYAQPVKTANGLWTIPVEASVENSGKNNTDIEVVSTLMDADGKAVVQRKQSGSVNALGTAVIAFSLPVTNPKLWNIESPHLYTVRTVITANSSPADTVSTTCGFRTIRFTADSGFYLNDKRVKIKGTCNHQDHAGVGVAVPASLWEFRLRKLKEMGSNANRCAHNPPSNEFLDACDKAGMLVMDENRSFNTSPEYMRQLEWMVRRDRNHPSIILWSVFNEEPMQGTETGYEMVRRMHSKVKALDTTRPVTAAANGGLFAPVNVSQAVDVVGFNYQIENYDRFHREHPEMAVTSSEDVCAPMTRWEYNTNAAKHVIAAYDLEKSSWGATHRDGWKAIAERPFMAGCFIWTGFDYRGEPQPLEWPTASSSFGTMDVCGFPKTAYYIHQAQWRQDTPVLQLAPHWNWPKDSIGKNIRVLVMSNAEKVKVYLNTILIKEALVDKYEMLTLNVPYLPGKLEAVGFTNEKEVSRFAVETSTEPASIELIADRETIRGDGEDAVPVTVRVLDIKGRPVPTANLPVTFEVNGAGTIIGLGNGDANSHEPEKGGSRSLYNGLAQVILQSKANSAGPLSLTARSAGLKPFTVTIRVKETKQQPIVDVVSPYILLDKWRVSPISVNRPDANQALADYDQNSWQPTRPGQLQTFTDGSFAIYRTSFTPYKAQQNRGGKITLKSVKGKAEVWLDKKLLATKTTDNSEDLTVNLPAGKGKREMSVLVETGPDKQGGLGGLITIE